MAVYEWQEKTYLKYDTTSTLRSSITRLYRMILDYEATLLVHLHQNQLRQWADSVSKAGDWSNRVKDMQEQDAKCRDITTAIDANSTVQWRNEERKWQEQLLQQPRLDEEDRHIRMLYSNYEAGKNVNPERIKGTCRWFLEHTDFITWRKARRSSLLWLSADPGCGKSVLSKYLIDRKGEVLTLGKQTPTVCYFFFKDGDIDRNNGAKAICALLHQLILQQPHLYQHAKEDFRTKNENFLADLGALWNIFLKATEDQKLTETICVLDALDECQESSRKALLTKLIQLYRRLDLVNDTRPILKFLVTSRPEIGIVRDFRNYTNVRLRGEEESEQITREIDLVIHAKIQELEHTLNLSESLKSDLLHNLSEVRHRTYLWLHLTFDAIQKKLWLSNDEVSTIAHSIPGDIPQAYRAILNKSPDEKKARRLLHIILAATRPLNLHEINVAMVMEKPYKAYEDLHIWPSEDCEVIIKNICGLFVSVVDSQVYLIHQTAREFLVGEGRSQRLATFVLSGKVESPSGKSLRLVSSDAKLGRDVARRSKGDENG